MMFHAVLLYIRYIFEFLLSSICSKRIALFVVMLLPFRNHIDKKFIRKIHGIDKENCVSNIFSAWNGLKKFARNNKKPYFSWMPAIPHPNGRTCQLHLLIYASNNSLPYFQELHKLSIFTLLSKIIHYYIVL